MRIIERFGGLTPTMLRQADRNARMRDANFTGTRMAGSSATAGTAPGSLLYHGRWGRTAWGSFRWR